METSNIKNLIFDLGGVIIDLDFQAAYKEFSDLSGLAQDEIIKRTEGLMFFKEYEMGLIDSVEFRTQICELLDFSAPDHSIDKAWCAMLGRIPANRLNLLRQLRDQYRVFALSNTNDIHVRKFNDIIENTLGKVQLLHDHFEKVYYSHEMKMRKPNTDIYQSVLRDQDLVPEETLFIDDNFENIKGAETLNIQTFHLEDPQQLFTFFNGSR